MKVRIIVGAQAAYACIETPTRSMDVKLNPGKSAIDSLEQTAREMMEDIERRQLRAALIRAAADHLAGSTGEPVNR